MQNTEEIWRLVDAKKDDFEGLSDRVWDTPELCYGEFRSCAEHTTMLEKHGFRVTQNVAGIPTAVMGEAGGRWVVPTVQAWGGTYAIGTRGHSWQVTAQGKLPAAHKGLVHVAKVMAGTAVDVIGDEVLLARAKADHQARVSRNPYVCPLPDDLEPPITMSA